MHSLIGEFSKKRSSSVLSAGAPKCTVAFPEGSLSMSKTLCPFMDSPADRLTAVVVLAVPPLKLMMAILRISKNFFFPYLRSQSFYAFGNVPLIMRIIIIS